MGGKSGEMMMLLLAVHSVVIRVLFEAINYADNRKIVYDSIIQKQPKTVDFIRPFFIADGFASLRLFLGLGSTRTDPRLRES